MTMFQGRAREFIAYLSDAGTPVTGILYSDITVGIRKPTEAGFTEKVLAESDWLEIGDGYYALTLTETDTDTLGPILIKIDGASFDGSIWEDEIDPVPFGNIVDNSTCVLSGTIMDLGGDYRWQVPITFRPVNLPQSHNTALLTGDPIRTVCDVYGNFYVMLLRGVKVLVEIEKTAIRHVIEIPNQPTANIVDLLPPLEE